MDKIKPYDALRTKEDVQLQARTEKEQANDTFILAATFFFSQIHYFFLEEHWFHAFSGITFKINSFLAIFPLSPSPEETEGNLYPPCHKKRQSPATFERNADTHVGGCGISQNKSLHSFGCQHLLLALS